MGCAKAARSSWASAFFVSLFQTRAGRWVAWHTPWVTANEIITPKWLLVRYMQHIMRCKSSWTDENIYIIINDIHKTSDTTRHKAEASDASRQDLSTHRKDGPLAAMD